MGSKPDPRRVRTGAPDRQSQGRRGRVHSSLSSSPPAQGRPTCRVREPAGAASRGDPTEGELPRPRSLANGTEPHLANPRERFYGRVSGPRANPYRMGNGRPLEPPDSSSTRNPQSATRSMGVVETSPSTPRRDGEGAFETRRRAHPDRLERAQTRGLDARTTPPGVHRTQGVPVVRRGLVVARWTRGTPGAGAGACRRPAGPLRRRPGGAELWQELRDHSASLNRALNETVRIHSGPAWHVFQVSWVSSCFAVPLPLFFAFVLFLTPALLALPVGGWSWSAGPGRDTMPSTALMPTFTGTGGSTRPLTPSSRP
jgi:hypothetical protein